MGELVREAPAQDEMFLDDEEDEGTQNNKYLLFNLGDEVYGIDIANVTEIIEMQKITDVPNMPDFIKGVINLRGRVIPVMDLRLRFEMDERGYDDRTCIIIVNIDDKSMGFIVDTVAEVHDILEKDIEPPPAFNTDSGKNNYISGLGKLEDRATILIDVHRLLNERELEVIAEDL